MKFGRCIKICSSTIFVVITFYLLFWSNIPKCEDGKINSNIFSRYIKIDTSARLLLENSFDNCLENKNQISKNKFSMISDLYIKARSYSIINKITFITSIILTLIVIFWNSIENYFKERKSIFDISKVPQTTIIAMSLFSYSLNSEYKVKQNSCENLMRYVIYSKEDISSISKNIQDRLEVIDNGFDFTSFNN